MSQTHKIVSYNLNGIRSAHSKGLLDWIASEDPDVLCFQETKAQPADLAPELLTPTGYYAHYHSAQKKGYSGVAIWSKEAPLSVKIGCDNPTFDNEGRVIQANFAEYSVISVYFPSGTSGEDRQSLKEEFLDYFYDYLQAQAAMYPKLIVSGDYNICHEAIDIHDPVSNKNATGFLPHERAWIGKLFANGWTDSFRAQHPDVQKYSWWSYRAGARKNNKGWRIDYHAVSAALSPQICAAEIHNDAVHSDHCALSVEIRVGG